MFRLKRWTWGLVVAGVFLAMAGTSVLPWALTAPTPAEAPARPLDPKVQQQIRKLQLERRDELQREVKVRLAEYEAGRGILQFLPAPGKELLQAELDVATNAKQR